MFSPKNSYNKTELIACSNGELFTKEGDGRLPSDLMLMFDEIVNIDDFSGNYNTRLRYSAENDALDNVALCTCLLYELNIHKYHDTQR